jgi:hypothetical protein
MQHEDSLLAGAFDRHTYPPDGETRVWWGRLKRGYTYLSLQAGIEASAALGVTVNMINPRRIIRAAPSLILRALSMSIFSSAVRLVLAAISS